MVSRTYPTSTSDYSHLFKSVPPKCPLNLIFHIQQASDLVPVTTLSPLDLQVSQRSVLWWAKCRLKEGLGAKFFSLRLVSGIMLYRQPSPAVADTLCSVCPILLANETLTVLEVQDLCCPPISLGCQGYFLNVYSL